MTGLALAHNYDMLNLPRAQYIVIGLDPAHTYDSTRLVHARTYDMIGHCTYIRHRGLVSRTQVRHVGLGPRTQLRHIGPGPRTQLRHVGPGPRTQL